MRTVFRYFWDGGIIHDNRRLAKRGFYCMGFLERIMSGKIQEEQLCIRKQWKVLQEQARI